MTDVGSHDHTSHDHTSHDHTSHDHTSHDRVSLEKRDTRFPRAYRHAPDVLNALEHVSVFRVPLPSHVVPSRYRRVFKDACVIVRRMPDGYLTDEECGGPGVVRWGIFDDGDMLGGNAWDGAAFRYRGEMHRRDIYAYTLGEALAALPEVFARLDRELREYVACREDAPEDTKE